MVTREKDDQPSVEATVFEEAPDESFEPVEPTRIHNRADTQSLSGSNSTHIDLKEPRLESTDAKGEENAEQEEFQWDSPSGLSHRVSPKSYYSDDSVFNKLFNVFSFIMMAIGLVAGFMGGYMIRGFFVEVEAPQQHESYSSATTTNSLANTAPALPPEEAVSPPTSEAPSEAVVDTTPPSSEPPATLAPEPVATPPATVFQPPAKTKKPPAKTVAKIKTIKQIKILTANNQVIADIVISGATFKYSARPSSQPPRLILDLEGPTSTQTKNKIIAVAAAKPLANITVAKQSANSMRLVFNMKSKGSPKYTINRTKNGLKVVFRK